MGLVKYTTNIVLASLFAIAIVVFVINFALDNNSSVVLSSDPDYNSLQSSYQSNISQFVIDVNSSSGDFSSTTLDTGDQASKTGSQFKGGLGTVKNLAITSVSVGFKKIFGNDAGFGIFLTSLLALIIFIGIMYAYKAWIGRDPD